MQAATCHDVRLASQNMGSGLLNIHQSDESERPFRVIEEKIDVGILSRLPSSRGAKEVQMLHPKPLKLGFVLLQPCDDGITVHTGQIAQAAS